MYTLQTIKKSVMDIIGEDSITPTYWTSSNDIELENYINDAFEEVCILTRHYKEDLYIPLMANKKHYRISGGKGGQFLFLSSVRVLSNNDNLYMTDPFQLSRQDSRWMTSTGTPRLFYMVGLDCMRIVPYPTTSGDTLECKGVIIPPSYTDDDEQIDIGDAFIGAITSYASYMVFLSLRMFDKAALQLIEFNNVIGLYGVKADGLMQSAIKLQGLENSNARK